jgi:hypothetical protein
MTTSVRVKLDQPVTTRDGVRLSADVYLPAGEGPFPVLALRTIQDNQAADAIQWVLKFVEAGYAVVTQDCRGRFDSGGDWDPYVNETADGQDTIKWISSQQWCDGNVGMFGSGYMGYAQTRAALGDIKDIKILKAIAPSSSQQDNFGYWFTHGPFQWHTALNFLETSGRSSQTGALSLFNREELWSRLPLATAFDDVAEMPFLKQALEHNRYDEFWKDDSLLDRYEDIRVPALFITGWYDVLLHETVSMFQGFAANAGTEEARSKSKLIIGPWHNGNLGSGLPSGDVDFGPDSGVDLASEHVRWYDQRLRGIETGIDDEPPVRIFTMGENVWRFENEWPPASMNYRKFFLHGEGHANSVSGDGCLDFERCGDTEPVDEFIYDPANPVPTLGGNIGQLPGTVAGAMDRRSIQQRDDVLVYDTDVLPQDLEVTGSPLVTLWASSDCTDTDFAATVCDVHEDGRAIIICEGMVRTRFSQERQDPPASRENPKLAVPDLPSKYFVSLWHTSMVFKAGHRIRLELTSSNFPRFDRNPNTGHDLGVDAKMRLANNKVYHYGDYPTHLTLPVVER